VKIEGAIMSAQFRDTTNIEHSSDRTKDEQHEPHQKSRVNPGTHEG